VPLAGRPLIGHVLAAARDGGIEAVVVAKRGSELPSLTERVIEEPDEPRHPLCGILRALDFAGERGADCAVLVVACDMPFLSGALLRWLVRLPGSVALEIDGTIQPLPVRCMPAQRPELREALAQGRSLRSALGTRAARVITERELIRFGDPRRLLFGVNRREELTIAESWLAEAPGGSV
jgi:molybdopterin-guanine dinucleotide biosynthesis protein A